MNRSKKEKIIIIVTICLIIVILVSLIQFVIEKRKEKVFKEKEIADVTEFKSPEEVIIHMGGKYIKQETEIKNKRIKVNIYLQFNKELFDGEESNRMFFDDMVKSIAYVLKYQDFKLIDEKGKIEIEAKCDQSKESIVNIKINGEERYFTERENQIKFSKEKNKEEIPDTDIKINSPILVQLVNNSWSDIGVKFGTKETRVDKYDIYFEEGIKVRKIGKKVFNIIFNEKYKGSVVNNISTTSSKKEIEKKLGKPTFEENDFIGYKKNDLYIFFSENEISAYRYDLETEDELVQFIQEMQTEKSVWELANKLTDIWPDYDEYKKDEESLYINYATRGVSFQYNYMNENGLKLYNNYVGEVISDKTIKEIERDKIPNLVNIELSENSLVNKELNRLIEKEGIEYKNTVTGPEGLKDTKEKKVYLDIEIGENKTIVRFISPKNEFAESEIEDNIKTYTWKDDYDFIYSIPHKGIYIYNVKERTTKEILKEKSNLEIKGYQNGILYYDDKEIKI